jgi:type VI secretion system secreted protein Hcp
MNRKHVVAITVLAVICCAPAKPAQAQNLPPFSPAGGMVTGVPFYVGIKGTAAQNTFKSEVKPPLPRTGTIAGIRFSYQATLQVAQAGLPAGRRQYSPITFTKVWGPSSPQFVTALATNETLTKVTFEFAHQTITLTNAHVSSIKRYVGVPMGNEAADTRELEDISFTFQKIEIVDQVGGTAMDDWMATN